MKHYLLLLLIFLTTVCSAQVWTDRSIPYEIVLKKQYITIGYNTRYNIPNYVAEKLTYNMTLGSAHRDKFTTDIKLPVANQISTNMYTNSKYDRGHLAPAADFSFNQKIMDESFLMSNICPQTPTLNRKNWVKVEEYVRKLAFNCDALYIITGTIGNNGMILNKIGIPKYIYKAVIGIRARVVKYSFAVIYKNDNSTQTITNCVYTIDKLESVIGRDLFYQLQKENPNVSVAEGKIMMK